ncbi:MAG: amidohydrolase [Verrucomicrobia bacterium]|nr:amidohydrolase [Verrucomicrobiota bacterium]
MRPMFPLLRALLGLLLPLGVSAAEKCDLLVLAGRIHTGDPAQPRAEALAIRDGRLVFVGSREAAAAWRKEAARVLELPERTVLPGLNDAHMHLAGVGFRELNFDLEGTTSLSHLQERLRERAGRTPAGKWIVGRGWIESRWQPAVFPTAADLDAAAPDHPVVLVRADGHALVANTKALALADIAAKTPNPTGGEILRDATGAPTGMLIDAAMGLVQRHVPGPTEAEVEEALVVGAHRYGKLGWTGFQIAGHSWEESEMVRRLVAAGRIRLRVYDAVSGPGAGEKWEDSPGGRLVREGAVLGETKGRYTRRAIKLYMDGALGSRGAALLEPYADAPASRGLVMQQEAALLPLLIEALKQGIQIETHAIGDRGNRLVLDLYEKAFAAVPAAERKVAEPRWRIEHAQVISPADLPRFAKLGVIASMQPSHAIGDLFFAQARLGPKRLAGAYAWQSLWKSGAVLAFGSDAPVERGEPLIEFYAAVERRSLDGFANEFWHREERLTREQALATFTERAAYAAFEEGERGRLKVGQWADLSVFDADLMQVEPAKILQAKCVLTMVGGEIVHELK